ncbi:hypothetical protein [Aliiruegeria lutimaris]|uniref:Uncharacterized protein n=1 Tax=Aliiruegeria lutimaris TaxID=571298 RepID=A0A1G8JRX0_9RHOB|nr:hypothetical protein [Aliiruegeria lutimaris]SDI34039.1 hypothetical protein SAMN04488026_100248 [Aliiruegeria lutimaris]
MPLKADLEREVAELKRELEAVRKRATSSDDSASGEASEQTAEEDGDQGGDGKQSTLDWALGQLDGSELERLFREFVAELEDMQEHKPLLTLFGAFVLGYVLGRAR